MPDIEKIEALAPGTPVLDGAVTENIRQYNKATRLAKLSSIVLEKVDFRVLPAALRVEAAALKRELNVETELLRYDPADGECIATISWDIVLRDKRKKVAWCKASYVVFYYDLKDFSEDIIKRFIDHVGKTATYAYFRALYAQLDWSANLGSRPLPVMSFVVTAKDMRSKDSEA
ncbi:hypothetical protein AAFG13_33880 [Bradyrhizobium sp. B124]|uniref:hypothetical protein n=1 Tax=Bradyrhizobium sp. B124 TaxID=3140245 RepID=UPI0031838ED4